MKGGKKREVTEKVKRKKKEPEMDSCRERESHGVRLWGCERKKRTQGGERTKKKR